MLKDNIGISSLLYIILIVIILCLKNRSKEGDLLENIYFRLTLIVNSLPRDPGTARNYFLHHPPNPRDPKQILPPRMELHLIANHRLITRSSAPTSPPKIPKLKVYLTSQQPRRNSIPGTTVAASSSSSCETPMRASGRAERSFQINGL